MMETFEKLPIWWPQEKSSSSSRRQLGGNKRGKGHWGRGEIIKEPKKNTYDKCNN
jgi:hypothetical protein